VGGKDNIVRARLPDLPVGRGEVVGVEDELAVRRDIDLSTI
jgi:hypothetical protein